MKHLRNLVLIQNYDEHHTQNFKRKCNLIGYPAAPLLQAAGNYLLTTLPLKTVRFQQELTESHQSYSNAFKFLSLLVITTCWGTLYYLISDYGLFT